MPAVESIEVPLSPPDRGGHSIRIRLLPETDATASPAPLFDFRADPKCAEGLEPIQLLEDFEYHYELSSAFDSVQFNPSDFFKPDDSTGKSGRIRTERRTGLATVSIVSGLTPIGTFNFEIRSRKLNYLREYRWMLRDLADSFGDLLLEGFSASQQRLQVDENRQSELHYQRFAFIKNLLEGEAFSAALQRILHRPHFASRTIEEFRDSTKGIPARGKVLRQLVKPGPRIKFPLSTLNDSIPVQIAVERTDESDDNYPNRFIKFVLTRWRSESAILLDRIKRSSSREANRRGEIEAEGLIEKLDGILALPLFRRVSKLERIEPNNQVLLRREGYRDIFQAYLQADLAGQLAWSGGDSVYGAGQKDVAALYEYWCFIQLATLLGRACGGKVDLRQLVEESIDGLSLSLRRGKESRFRWQFSKNGRPIQVQLLFNRTFSKSNDSSWSVPMRPDFSIQITTPSDLLGAKTGEVWLHFDAKYRVNHISDILEDSSDPSRSITSESVPKREDLLKMHSYRDAIRRSAGAYVLYPGTDEQHPLSEFREVIPGLGAFRLVPNEDGPAQGTDSIERFLRDVIAHAASQSTQHERSRFWESAIASTGDSPIIGFQPFLSKPPADTPVLLGYVKSPSHLDWIRRERLYNVRASGRRGSIALGGTELAAEFILLYNPELELVELRSVVGPPLIFDSKRMREAEYPSPKGEYFCFQIGAPIPMSRPIPPMDAKIVAAVARGIAPTAPPFSPAAISWAEFSARLWKR